LARGGGNGGHNTILRKNQGESRTPERPERECITKGFLVKIRTTGAVRRAGHYTVKTAHARRLAKQRKGGILEGEGGGVKIHWKGIPKPPTKSLASEESVQAQNMGSTLKTTQKIAGFRGKDYGA